jgi:hypothetical protein
MIDNYAEVDELKKLSIVPRLSSRSFAWSNIMSKKNAIGWFEIPVTDMERAVGFYEKVFRVALTRFSMGPLTMAWFPMLPDAPGSMGSLVQGETYVPSYAGTMVYFMVDDIERTLEAAAQNGGKILNPKMSIGEFGFVGHFEDCEGNRVALHSTQ